LNINSIKIYKLCQAEKREKDTRLQLTRERKEEEQTDTKRKNNLYFFSLKHIKYSWHFASYIFVLYLQPNP
jgi:hypothetical protein